MCFRRSSIFRSEFWRLDVAVILKYEGDVGHMLFENVIGFDVDIDDMIFDSAEQIISER